MKRSEFLFLLGSGAMVIPGAALYRRKLSMSGQVKAQQPPSRKSDPRVFADDAHKGAVMAVQFLPDGARFISSGVDDRAVLWDFKSRNQLRVFQKANDFRFQDIVFTPKGDKAINPRLGGARCWDPRSGETLRDLKADTGMLSSVAISPDGTRVAAGGFDSAIYVWDIETGNLISPTLSTASIHSTVSTAFLSDNEVVAADENGAITTWALHRPEEPTGRWSTDLDMLQAVFVSKARRVIVGTRYGELSLWDLKEKRAVWRGESIRSETVRLASSKDGELFCSSGYDRKIRLWSARISSPIDSAAGPWPLVSCLTFVPGENILVLGTQDGKLWTW